MPRGLLLCLNCHVCKSDGVGLKILGVTYFAWSNSSIVSFSWFLCERMAYSLRYK